MTNYFTVKASPNRANIKLIVLNQAARQPYNCPESMKWLISNLKCMKERTPRTILYCRTHVQCHSMYGIFEEALGSETGLFAMYHGTTHPDVQQKVVKDFENPEGQIRLLFATIAFGMGVDVKSVHTIIHMGVPSDIDDYLQESGRAGRDGRQSVSVIITYPGMYAGTRTSERMKAYAQNKSECRRAMILRAFDGAEDVSTDKKHFCCDICAPECTCESGKVACPEEANILAHFGFGSTASALQRREVTREHREALEERLTSYRLSLLETDQGTSRYLAGKDLATGIPQEYLNEIVMECDTVYPNVEAFSKRYPFYDSLQASVIWDIVNEVLGECTVYSVMPDGDDNADNDGVDEYDDEYDHVEDDDGDVSNHSDSEDSNRSVEIDSDLLSDSD